ncbi:7-carboxy-7-deazaguanine synthase QueE [Segatella copri]|jgi:7-carboxy-7-deazaguanine synthase|uniref:7-carboxy-7-deazaguanine synthase QueE n=1 Tax=Segatella copri TaxID=165179 RepID=UPI001932CA39|nr:7-carboxy-7-deazaguanine synthase QueE [Segatella copri]MBM0143968.1 radical SAM protein [Segatella copri]
MYKVNEIFYSLQGEGRWMGRPAVFVRMSGCNLKCPFCDTDFRGYREMSADDILSKCLEEGGECRFIVLTGGEPSLQVDEQLIATLHQAGYYLSMETNGTHAIPEGIDWVTCSPKVDFTEGGELVVRKVDELKLIFDGEHEVSDHGIACTFRYLQPCDVGNDSRNYLILSECIKYIKAHPEWQLSVQMHKIVGIR